MSLLCKLGFHTYEEIKKCQDTNIPFSSYTIYRCKRCDRTITMREHTGAQGTFREVITSKDEPYSVDPSHLFGLFLVCAGILLFLLWFLV